MAAASKDFRIRAVIETVDQSSQTLAKLRSDFAAAHQEIDRLAASEAALAREAAAAGAATESLAASTQRTGQAAATTSSHMERQLRNLLGLGSAVAVLATVERGIRLVANASEQTKTDFELLTNELSVNFAPAAEQVSTLAAAIAGALHNVSDAGEQSTTFFQSFIQAVTNSIVPLDILKGKVNELADAERARAEKVAGFWSRGDAEATAFGDRVAAIRDIVDSFGITLEEDVNNAIDANRAKIALLTQAYDDHLISEELLKQGTAALQQEIDRLSGTASEAAPAVDVLGDSLANANTSAQALDSGIGSLTVSSPELIAAIKELTVALQSVRQEADATNISITNLSIAQQRATGLTRGGNVDLSLAARSTNPINAGFGGTFRSSLTPHLSGGTFTVIP